MLSPAQLNDFQQDGYVLVRGLYPRERIARTGVAIDALAAQLLDGPAVPFKEEINLKLPGGPGFASHQNIQPGWATYASYFISVLVTIDPSTIDNGCLEFAAASTSAAGSASGTVLLRISPPPAARISRGEPPSHRQSHGRR